MYRKRCKNLHILSNIINVFEICCIIAWRFLYSKKNNYMVDLTSCTILQSFDKDLQSFPPYRMSFYLQSGNWKYSVARTTSIATDLGQKIDSLLLFVYVPYMQLDRVFMLQNIIFPDVDSKCLQQENDIISRLNSYICKMIVQRPLEMQDKRVISAIVHIWPNFHYKSIIFYYILFLLKEVSRNIIESVWYNIWY